MISADTLALPGGVWVSVRLPEGARRVADEALPIADVSGLPGAWIAARAGWAAGSVEVTVICAAGPAAGWAPGVEELVLGRASQIAERAIGGEGTRLPAGAIEAEGPRFGQAFAGVVRRGEETQRARGRHVLGFAGEPRVGIACTIICVEPEASGICEGLIVGAAAEGAWRQAPPPSALSRSILLAAERPYEVLGAGGAAALLIAALVIAKRPRPRA